MRVILSVLAIAQASPTEPHGDPPPVVIPDVTVIDVEDAVDVHAGLVRPGVVSSVELLRHRFNPLIRLREDFAADLSASLRDAR